jgi:hypothetical protein
MKHGKDTFAEILNEQFGLKYCTCYDSDFRLVPIKSLSYNSSFVDSRLGGGIIVFF